ncbi:MAG: UpxY family transcription antiterminator [Melioribacteraceae bacterium]|nr:UpxY family transcription antiterminator [Melioribacteraceae bacterium]
MNTEQQEKKWFALYTKPRHEFKAEEQINKLSIECFLPKINVKRKWKDRKKNVETALFTSYIFIHATEIERRYALALDSIVKTVCFNGKPAVIPNDEIESIKILLENKADVYLTDNIKRGNKVKIIEGPFKDAIGTVLNVNSENWLYVSIEVLQRTVSVKLTKDCVYRLME